MAVCGTVQSMDEPEEEGTWAQPGPDDELNERLAELEQRASELRAGVRAPEPPDWNYKRPERIPGKPVPGDGYRGLGIGIALGFGLFAPIVLGYVIGYWIDRRSGGTTWQTWLTVVGMFVGFIGVVVLISRTGKARR